MNSGSESVTVSLRIADVNANLMTQPGGKHEGKTIKMMAVEQGFHGRTDRPAQMSHSCKGKYDKHLASFQNRDNLILVPANDVQALEQAFTDAAANNVFIELMAIEPFKVKAIPGSAYQGNFTMQPDGSRLRTTACSWLIQFKQVSEAKAPCRW